jgi:hypothetical protein
MLHKDYYHTGSERERKKLLAVGLKRLNPEMN